MSELKRQESLVDEATVLEYLARYPEFSCVTGPCWTRSAFPMRKGHHLPGGAPAGQTAGAHRAAGAGDHRTDGVASENERIFRVYADLYGEIYGCQTLFELSAVMGKAFVQRLRLTGLRLWLNPRHFQLSGPEQRFLAQGKQLEQLLGQRLPGTDYYFGRLNQSEKQALFGNDVLVNSVALMRLGELGVLAFASSDPSHFTPTTTPCCWVSWGVCCSCVCPSWPVAKATTRSPAKVFPAADPCRSHWRGAGRLYRIPAGRAPAQPHTRSNYQAHLEAMTAELVKLGVDDWARLEASQVRSLVTRMHKGAGAPFPCHQGVGPAQLLRLAGAPGAAHRQPGAGHRHPKQGRPLPKNLDVDEMYQLLNITDEQDPLAVRDRAIMELMYSSGLRLAELVGLNLADVKLDERQLRVIGKGSRERVLPIGRMAVEWLHKWLKVRPCWPVTRGRHCSSPSAGSGSRPARYRSGSTAGATSRLSMPTCTPQAAPQLRHPHAGILRRPAGGAGAAGACGSLHHPDLYPPRLPASGQGI